jgi:hypothetical protein
MMQMTKTVMNQQSRLFIQMNNTLSDISRARDEDHLHMPSQQAIISELQNASASQQVAVASQQDDLKWANRKLDVFKTPPPRNDVGKKSLQMVATRDRGTGTGTRENTDFSL